MVADGSAKFAEATGLVKDLTERGMGVRCQRFSMIVDTCPCCFQRFLIRVIIAFFVFKERSTPGLERINS